MSSYLQWVNKELEAVLFLGGNDKLILNLTNNILILLIKTSPMKFFVILEHVVSIVTATKLETPSRYVPKYSLYSFDQTLTAL